MNAPLCYQYLSERGITDETIKLYGLDLHEQVSQKITKDRLGRTLPHGYIECIWIPLHDKAGNVRDWIARPLPTIPEQPKFVCPVGSHNLAFVPHSVYKLAYGKELILTEAPIKALAVQQTGFDCVGLNGVWGASLQNSGGLYVITAQLQQALEWRGRKVYLALDTDADINPKVRHALFRLYFVLTVAGAEVFRLDWPSAEGKGIDDFLVHQVAGNGQSSPLDRLRALMTGAQPFINSVSATSLDLDIVCSELEKVLIPGLLRDQLCKPLANRLGVRTEILRELNSRLEKAKPELSFAANYEPWPEPVDAEELLSEVIREIKKEALITEAQAHVAGLEVFLTWVHEQMDFSPIFYISAPTRECGKTRLLNVMGKMVRRPLKTSSISPAALFRLSERYHPTFLVDEAQDAFKNEDFSTIMKAGHDPSDVAVRCAPNTNEPETFDVFCPKVVAGIGRANGQIMSRSIVMEMERRAGEVDSSRKATDPVFVEIRRKLARWPQEVGNLRRFHLPKEKASMRQKDNWEVFYRVACGISEYAAEELLRFIPSFINEEEDFDTYLLNSLRRLYQQHELAIRGGHLGTEMILEALNADKEAPWYAEHQGREGKGLSPEKLSRRLRKYKVRPKRHWHTDIGEKGMDLRGYFYIDPDPKPSEKSLEMVFDQYLVPEK